MSKILQVNIDDLNTGGVFALIKNYIGYNKSKENVIDIATIEGFQNKNNEDFFKKYNSKIYFIGYKKSKLLKQFFVYKNLRKLIQKNKYDYIHIHSDVAYKMIAPAIAAKCEKKKIIFHSHAAGVDGKKRYIKNILHRFSRKFLKEFNGIYVTCSDLAANWMYPNINKNKIIKINNGIDLRKFKYNEEVRKKERQLLKVNKEILIGNVGRFTYQKNHEYLIEIAKELKKRKINFKMIFVGEGELKDKFEKLVYKEELENFIIFYGITNEIEKIFMAMDLFLLPSRFEGLPIVGVEAQCSGLPVFFSNNITKEVKFMDNVKFLNIYNKDIKQWGDEIENCKFINRKIGYERLKENLFDINDMVNSFNKLYI